ncbi:hypothetical protein, partial [Agarivorans sp.]|uniref:hypothetical protein n=1 Tax=Agarivorans sp. TaxID=1872412 RepID=UPI003CFF552E
MSELDIKKLMADCAKDAQNFAKQNYNFELKMAASSVPMVDEILSQIDGDDISDQDLFTLSYMLGAFLGEVFIREVGGHWIYQEETEEEPPQTFLKIGENTIAFPSKVYHALVGNSEESIQQYYQE